MRKPELTVYGRSTIPFTVDSLSVSQEVGKHDMFTAWLPRPEPIVAEDLKGYPCVLRWNGRSQARELRGFIDTVTGMQDQGTADKGGLAVIGLGASTVMRNGAPRTWLRRTPHQIAKNILAPYRFGLITDKYVTSLDAFMQTGESDWQALARLADTTGMELIAHDTTIMIVDVRKAIGRSMGKPIVTITDTTSLAQLETLSPPGYDRYMFTGIDRLGAKFTVRGGPPDGVYRHTDRNFSSLEDARMAERRHEDRLRHYVRAVIDVPGQIAIRTGDVVLANGERWFVAKCKTEVRQASFNSYNTLELHRPLETRPAAASNAIAPPPTLRGGTWVAESSFEVEL